MSDDLIQKSVEEILLFLNDISIYGEIPNCVFS